VSRLRLVLNVMATSLLLVAAGESPAATADSTVSMIEAGRFDDALKVLSALTTPTPRQSGLECYLYVRGLVAYDTAAAKTSCAAAVAAGDTVGLFMSGVAAARSHPPEGFSHDETLALGRMADAVKLDYYPAYEWLCQHDYEKSQFTEASPFCKVAAVHGRPASTYYLGLMLYNGNGAVQDFEKAREFILASAKMNYAAAYELLGDLARDGRWGTPKDLTQAYAWYALASSAAPDWAEPIRNRGALDLSASKIAAAQKLAASWATQAAPGILD